MKITFAKLPSLQKIRDNLLLGLLAETDEVKLWKPFQKTKNYIYTRVLTLRSPELLRDCTCKCNQKNKMSLKDQTESKNNLPTSQN